MNAALSGSHSTQNNVSQSLHQPLYLFSRNLSVGPEDSDKTFRFEGQSDAR
jgi:hypothetical protein